MGSGICYTQSGSVKKYEGINRGDVPDKVTVYTVGYPSTAYYPDGGEISFSIIPYPPPPGYPTVEGFVEGTAHYISNMYLNSTGSNSTYKKIYDLMSYTPPDGYVLDKNGEDYIVTKFATVYSYNYGIKYYDKTNIINGATQTIKKEFRYKKKDEDKPNTDIKYYVTLTLNSGKLNCKCNRVTGIPGTDNGNFILEIHVQLTDRAHTTLGYHDKWFQFSWVMKNGIDENKSCNVPYYLGSGFNTKNSWEIDNGDGTKTYYTFYINADSIQRPQRVD